MTVEGAQGDSGSSGSCSEPRKKVGSCLFLSSSSTAVVVEMVSTRDCESTMGSCRGRPGQVQMDCERGTAGRWIRGRWRRR